MEGKPAAVAREGWSAACQNRYHLNTTCRRLPPRPATAFGGRRRRSSVRLLVGGWVWLRVNVESETTRGRGGGVPSPPPTLLSLLALLGI